MDEIYFLLILMNHFIWVMIYLSQKLVLIFLNLGRALDLWRNAEENVIGGEIKQMNGIYDVPLRRSKHLLQWSDISAPMAVFLSPFKKEQPRQISLILKFKRIFKLQDSSHFNTKWANNRSKDVWNYSNVSFIIQISEIILAYQWFTFCESSCFSEQKIRIRK